MTFAVLLTGRRSIAFGSGIQGSSSVLAIINSQFIRWCPPFCACLGLVVGRSIMTAGNSASLMLAPAEFVKLLPWSFQKKASSFFNFFDIPGVQCLLRRKTARFSGNSRNGRVVVLVSVGRFFKRNTAVEPPQNLLGNTDKADYAL